MIWLPIDIPRPSARTSDILLPRSCSPIRKRSTTEQIQTAIQDPCGLSSQTSYPLATYPGQSAILPVSLPSSRSQCDGRPDSVYTLWDVRYLNVSVWLSETEKYDLIKSDD
ncbi:hypothetical protein SARC_07077, partial [Sphaeroforma arctica JP610]